VGRSLGALLDLGDVAQVEVLRGPQGTLFGKNTIGGALNITSPRPDLDRVSGMAEVTGGRFGRIDGRAAINLPLASTLALRVSGATLNYNGYGRRITTGERLGGRDTLVGSAQLLYQPSETFEAVLRADGTRTRGDSAVTTLTGLADGTFIQPGDTTPLRRSGALDAIFSTAPPGSAPITFANYRTDSPFRTRGIGPNFTKDDIWGVSLTLTGQLSDTVSAKSISAYRDVRSKFGRDAYNLPFLSNSTTDDYKLTQFTQELQLSGQTDDKRFDWVAGVFYLEERGRNFNQVAFNRVILPPFTGVPPSSRTATLFSGGEVDNYSIAGYGQANFSLTERLRLTAGLRYSFEDKEFDTRRTQFILESGRRLAPAEIYRQNYDDFSPRLGADYRLSDDVFTYASYSTGFKGGGFVQRVFPGALIDPTFRIRGYGPETAEVYEGGLKISAFDRRLRLNVAGFFTDYQDVQTTVREGFTPQTVNSGQVEITGAELEAEARPFDGLVLTGVLGYLDAKYKRVDPLATDVNLDSKLPYTSKWTANASASYTLEDIAGDR
jgi:iron complex outermembrane receptor protein